MMESFYITSWDIFRLIMSNWNILLNNLLLTAVLPMMIPLMILIILLLGAKGLVRDEGMRRAYRKRIMLGIYIVLIALVVIIVIDILGPLITLPGKYGYSIINNTLTLYLPTGTYTVNLTEADICVVNVTQAMRIDGFAYGPLGMGLFLINGRHMNVFLYATEGLRWIYVIKYGREVLGLYAPGLKLPIRCG